MADLGHVATMHAPKRTSAFDRLSVEAADLLSAHTGTTASRRIAVIHSGFVVTLKADISRRRCWDRKYR